MRYSYNNFLYSLFHQTQSSPFIYKLYSVKDTLEVLNLGGNHLSDLPRELLGFRKLRILFLGSNDFTEVPSFLGLMSSLYMLSFKSNKLRIVSDESLSPSIGWLILTDNLLEQLPAAIGKLTGLRKLMLANNRLSGLPIELSLCRELELIRLSRNNLSVFPEWIFEMPKLAWLALSGNPASDISNAEISNIVPSETLTLGEVIGEGASGVVYKVESTRGVFTYDASRFNGVAVKLFKGDCNSDGHPSDEVYVSGRVGFDSTNVLPVLACIAEVQSLDRATVTDKNAIKYGLVFPLIPPDCIVLALPPSFSSVTRDIYPAETVFSTAIGIKILRGLASAGAYIHDKGIMHGDIYGHNIHVYSDGEPILVDFGAATAYGHFSSGSKRSKFEALDVRAFGCIIEEILERITDTTAAPADIMELKDRC